MAEFDQENNTAHLGRDVDSHSCVLERGLDRAARFTDYLAGPLWEETDVDMNLMILDYILFLLSACAMRIVGLKQEYDDHREGEPF